MEIGRRRGSSRRADPTFEATLPEVEPAELGKAAIVPAGGALRALGIEQRRVATQQPGQPQGARQIPPSESRCAQRAPRTRLSEPADGPLVQLCQAQSAQGEKFGREVQLPKPVERAGLGAVQQREAALDVEARDRMAREAAPGAS